MKNSKVLCVILALLVCMTIAVSAFATTEDHPTFTLDHSGVKVDSGASVTTGQEFTVTVSISENPGFLYAEFSLKFDETKLELTNVVRKLSDAYKNYAYKTNKKKVQIGDGTKALMSPEDCNVVDATGEIVTFTFKVIADNACETAIELKGIKYIDLAGGPASLEDVALNISVQDPGHVHNFVAYEGKAATCTEEGYTAYTKCECGVYDVEKQIIPVDPNAHNFVNYVSDDNATCTTDGTETAKCERCDKTDTRVIEGSAGHTESEIPAVDATCTATGLTAGVKCSVCGEILVEQVVTEMIDHTVVIIDAVAPTCTKTGLTEGEKCSVCGEILVEQEEVAMLPHEYVENRFEATCTEDGLITKKCADCNAVDFETIPATGHDMTKVDAFAATCENKGSNEYYVCNDCGKAFKDVDGLIGTTAEAEAIPTLDHVFTNYVNDENATCTANGTETAKCENCDATYTREIADSKLEHTFVEYDRKDAKCEEDGKIFLKCANCPETTTEDIPATGHNTTKVGAVAAECERDGNREYYVCDNCGKVFMDASGETVTSVEAETIPALGHKFENYVYDEGSATCTDNGTKTAKCERCDVSDTIEAEGTAIGHDWFVFYRHETETCTENGFGTWQCNNCGEQQDGVIYAYGHNMVKTDAVKPTCTTDGTNEYYTCNNCGVVFKDAEGKEVTTVEAEFLAALGHTMEKIEAVVPTCKATGNNEYYHCVTCGKYFKDEAGEEETTVDDEILAEDPENHDWDEGEETTAPTHFEKGVWTYTCTLCGATRDEEIDYTAHEWSDFVDDEYCGCLTTHTAHCTIEGCEATKTEVKDPADHVYPTYEEEPKKFEIIVAATCQTDGIAKAYCKYCGEAWTEIKYSDPDAHDFKDYVLNEDRGCLTTETAHCSIEGCDATDTRVVDATNHVYPTYEEEPELFTPVAGHEGTCQKSGIAKAYCKYCGEAWIEVVYNDPNAHIWNDGKVTTEPGCAVEGVKTFECTLCDATKTEAIPATGAHVFPTYEEEPSAFTIIEKATCASVGTAQAKCKFCDAITEVEYTDTEKQHTWVVDKVITAPTCGAMGVNELKCSICGETMRDENVPATGEHTWDEGKITTAATVEKEGVKTFTCTVCKATKEEKVEKLEPKTSNTVIIVVSAVVVVLAGAGVASYFILKRKKK